jgi:hypothetical protein
MVAVPQPKASCIASTPGYTNSSITDLRRPSFKTCGSVPSSCSPLIGSSTWEDYSYSSSSSLPEFLSCEALLGGAVAAVLMWHKRSALTAAITEVVSAVAQVNRKIKVALALAEQPSIPIPAVYPNHSACAITSMPWQQSVMNVPPSLAAAQRSRRHPLRDAKLL